MKLRQCYVLLFSTVKYMITVLQTCYAICARATDYLILKYFNCTCEREIKCATVHGIMKIGNLMAYFLLKQYFYLTLEIFSSDFLPN